MTTLHLVRHGTTDFTGNTLLGRLPGAGLNDNGRIQAEAAAETLLPRQIRRVVSSPLDRCKETAQPLCSRAGLDLELSDALLEVNFGDWTGLPLEALSGDPLWNQFNTNRGVTRIPGGEMMLEAQARMVARLRSIAAETQGDVAVFGHGDPIRAALAFFLGIPIDLMQRFEISPGSISTVVFSKAAPRVWSLNGVPGT